LPPFAACSVSFICGAASPDPTIVRRPWHRMPRARWRRLRAGK
jgi:hypothetical protein